MALQLNTSTGIYGPFKNITDQGTYYDCDTAVYYKSVVGTGTVETYTEPQADIDAILRDSGTAEADKSFVKSIDVTRSNITSLAKEPRLRDTLGIIYSEYMAYQANNTVSTPAIQKLADVWGVTRGQAVTRVINKYGPYIPDIAEAFAVREDELDALP